MKGEILYHKSVIELCRTNIMQKQCRECREYRHCVHIKRMRKVVKRYE